MHKRIVEAIREAISQEEYKDRLRIFVLPQESNGFWQMCIIPDENFLHLLPHIADIGIHIGRYYGEGLSSERAKDYIIFS
jgi:hypothetical protein